MHAPIPDPTAPLRTTHTSTVTEEQIDHLGHMNVRYYALNAFAGTEAVLADLPGWDGRRHLVHDLYTRHHREQLLGSELVVRSALLESTADALRIHHELANVETGVLAATFVHGVSPVDDGGDRLPVPDAALAAARAEAVALPDHAATRTISLAHDPLADPPTLDAVRAMGLASRKERVIPADECDAAGGYRLDFLPLLTWGGELLDGRRGDDLHETADGKLIGWASMETRMRLRRLPRAGTRIQAFAACVDLLDKVTHDVHWAFDVDSGELLTAFETVSLAFDTRARRPASIPAGYRRRYEAILRPELAPG